MDRAHLRSIGVNDFIRWDAERSLILSPKFQRRRVWPTKAKAFLIDTILRGLPIPKLYMRQHLDVKTSKTGHLTLTVVQADGVRFDGAGAEVESLVWDSFNRRRSRVHSRCP